MWQSSMVLRRVGFICSAVLILIFSVFILWKGLEVTVVDRIQFVSVHRNEQRVYDLKMTNGCDLVIR